MHTSQCPLCGAAYSTPAELLRRIQEFTSARGAAAEGLAASLRSLQTAEASVDRYRQQLDTAERQLQQLEGNLERAQSRLSQISVELESSSPVAGAEGALPTTVPDSRALLFEIDDSLRASQSTKTQLEDDYRRALTSKREADSLLELRRRELQELTTELQARVGSLNISEIESRANLGQRQLLQARNHRETIEAEMALVANRLRQADELLIAEISQADAARSARARVEDRLEMTENDMRLELERIVGPQATEDTLESELRRSRDQEVRVADLVRKAREAATALEQNEKYRRAQALSDLRRETQGEYKKVTRALQRLSEVNATVSARAAREEASATEHYRTAIQECFSALLPHRHLNELSVDSTSGELYATDRFLEGQQNRRVRPASYFSTGQANALALSMFLGTALRQRITRFDFLLLDEPIQNMDDVHFLAFMTLAKRMALSNQMVISTADGNVAELFRRQMASSWRVDRSSFVEYEWLNFNATTGPEIKVHSHDLTSRPRQA